MRRDILVLLPPASYALQLYNQWLKSRGWIAARELVPISQQDAYIKPDVVITATPVTAPGAKVRGSRYDEVVILAPDVDQTLVFEALKTLGGM